jgi:hypothetical protein
MTEQATAPAATDNSASATPAAAVAPAAAPADVAPAVAPAAPASTQPQGAEGKASAPAATPAATTPQAPEKYEFKAPEGVSLDPSVVSELSGVAKELGLSQEAAQKLVDKLGPAVTKATASQQQAAVQAAVAQMEAASKADPELGGKGDAKTWDTNIAIAQKGFQALASDGLRKLLADSGLHNHPEVIRAFFRAGQKLTADNVVPGGTKPPEGAPKDLASRLYGNAS